VAVTGLPEATEDHALIMCRFAWKMKLQMLDACKKLEAVLGPGTADLCLRIGIHSGAVTAGVLRGDKSRFQLFGDTMNTASRIESTSLPNQIQLSHTTAELLSQAGKQHWLAKRSTKVEAKGKGSLQTFWLQHINHFMTSDTPPSDVSSSARQSSMNLSISSNSVNSNEDMTCPQQFSNSLINLHENQHSHHSVNTKLSPHQVGRMIHWNFEILYQSLEKIVRMRCMLRPTSSGDDLNKDTCAFPQVTRCKVSMMHPIQEIPNVVELCEHEEIDCQKVTEPVELSENIRQQLRDFIWKISTLYRNNPFHNLDHASHVLMSANKLLNRIVSEKVKFTKSRSTNMIDKIHEFSFKISCDPLAQFAILFSALIHDVDHTGITNTQLVKENADIAARYNGQSVAEQNSLTVAWNTLLEAQYEDLFIALFPTDTEEKRFRQLITTIVLATDIMDANLKQRRDQRWDTVFSANSVEHSNDENIRNQEATIIMEYIMQASDIAHTMQHWHVYCKWSRKLFEEKYTAYLDGHEEKDPSIDWYDNEILFFDKYIIPLAKKLKECGVFGVCSDEYLGFAMDNRMEWEIKGRDVVKSMLLDTKMDYRRIGKESGCLQAIESEG
jgi:3'5'-cyclic nucleotide phosphodiesterase/Adenylate and Guanylate cyclase catalytic domain